MKKNTEAALPPLNSANPQSQIRTPQLKNPHSAIRRLDGFANKKMRVIAGQYKGRTLKSPPSLDIRPTSDRLRETLFNVLAPRIADARFLDLCAGSGAIGIEALSRGARFVTFVDRSRKMCGLVEANLDLCGVPEDQTEVVMNEAGEFVRRIAARVAVNNNQSTSWDIVFFDPPYAQDYLPVLETFGQHADALLADEAILIAEHHHKREMKDEIGSIRRWRMLKQGDSCLSMYERS